MQHKKRTNSSMETLQHSTSNTTRSKSRVRQKSKRNTHRTADKNTFIADSIYSLKLFHKNKFVVSFHDKDYDLLNTDNDVIKCCHDLLESCDTDIIPIKDRITGLPCNQALQMILLRLEINYPHYQLHLNKTEDNEFYVLQLQEIELDSIRFINITFLLSLCGDNHNLKMYLYNTIHRLSKLGIDNCFNSDLEEMWIERVKEEYDWTIEKETGDPDFKETKKQLLSTIHYYRFGEFAQEKKLYNIASKMKFTANPFKDEKLSIPQVRLLCWIKAALKIIACDYSLYKFINETEQDYNDGLQEATKFVRFNWTNDSTKPMHLIGEQIIEDANNMGVGCFSFTNIITPISKEIAPNRLLNDYLTLMDFENDYK